MDEISMKMPWMVEGASFGDNYIRNMNIALNQAGLTSSQMKVKGAEPIRQL